ncbi:glycosyl transferase [Marinagarivorans algicola]|uniref:glycosyl transferase n=1 Tax=Marinagarivorans algicola TaxID=1513270 RepID=UPI0006B89929|nr:glycosyl transferase [Marinagarivorans algicola]
MQFFPVFLSAIVVIKDQETKLSSKLKNISEYIAPRVSDYEVVVVVNGGQVSLINEIKELTSEKGIPNLQVYVLTKEVDSDTASWVGLEPSLGDYSVVIDMENDDYELIERMLEEATSGSDVVFASNEQEPPCTLFYRLANSIFNALFKRFNGVNLTKDAPNFRMMSKTVINFILQHKSPVIVYKFLPATGGFAKKNLSYSYQADNASTKKLRHALAKGSKLAFSSTQFPMRVVTLLTLFGAGANLLYSIYVLWVSFMNPNVISGWASLSLQQSGMFVLLSMVLFILGEYILNVVKLANDGPDYHVAAEFTSALITRRNKLNLEDNTNNEG